MNILKIIEGKNIEAKVLGKYTVKQYNGSEQLNLTGNIYSGCYPIYIPEKFYIRVEYEIKNSSKICDIEVALDIYQLLEKDDKVEILITKKGLFKKVLCTKICLNQILK